MNLRCSVCHKYKDEEDFGIGVDMDESKSNPTTEQSIQSAKYLRLNRKGRQYQCKECYNKFMREKWFRDKEDNELVVRDKIRRRRHYLKGKLKKEGYKDWEAADIAEKEVPYRWNDDKWVFDESFNDYVMKAG